METNNLKAAVTVAEMARILGISRARLYQLVRQGAFPPPAYQIESHRPVYVREQQLQCLEVRRRNFGVNGQPILFYCQSSLVGAKKTKKPSKAATKKTGDHADITAALSQLGVEVAEEKVAVALKSIYPGGIEDIEKGEVIRALFCQLRQSGCEDSADNVGR